jgi:hypothetical protein
MFSSGCLSLKVSDNHTLIKSYPHQEIICNDPNTADPTTTQAHPYQRAVDFDKISERPPFCAQALMMNQRSSRSFKRYISKPQTAKSRTDV